MDNSIEANKKLIAELKAENARLRATKQKEIRIAVSQKGAVSFYGLGRFPVTLYGEQWMTLLEKAEDIKSFIATNSASLKTKGA